MCEECSTLKTQYEDLKRQVDEQAKDLYAMFEHLHAMTAEAGGIKSRWDRHMQGRYAVYIERKRLFGDLYQSKHHG